MPDDALPFKRTYAAEPDLRERVFDCLDEVFPGVCAHERAAAALGFRWEDVSTPFVRAEGGRILSHVGLIEMDFVLEGKRTLVGVIHGVATRPNRRREGLYRSVMDAALRHADELTAAQVLCTAQPELYTPFGFRALAEHRFIMRMSPPREGARHRPRGAARPLLTDDPRDLARIEALLEGRAPVSERLGVVRERVAFAFNEIFRPLLYLEDLDAVVSIERSGGTLRVFDVVAREMPRLDALLERLDPTERVEIYFTPDRLAVEAAPEPWTMRDAEDAVGGKGDTILMARGPFPPEGRPFMLPRSARC